MNSFNHNHYEDQKLNTGLNDLELLKEKIRKRREEGKVFQLDNKITVIWRKPEQKNDTISSSKAATKTDSTKDFEYFQIVFKCGQKDGVALNSVPHMAEHVILSRKKWYDKLIETVGDINGIATKFLTYYPSKKLKSVMPEKTVEAVENTIGMLFDRNFDKEAFEIEKEIVIAEDAAKRSEIGYDVREEFTKKIGFRYNYNEDLERVTLEDVERFIEEHYIPEKMIVNLICSEDNLKSIINILNKLPKSTKITETVVMRREFSKPDFPKTKGFVKRDVEYEHWKIGEVDWFFEAPNELASDRQAFSICCSILNKRLSDVLYNFPAHSFGCIFDPTYDYGVVDIYIGRMLPKNINRAIEIIKNEIEKIKYGVTEKEIEFVKQKIKKNWLSDLSDESSTISILFDELVIGGLPPEERLDRFFNITPESVVETAKKYFDFDNSMLVVSSSKKQK